MRADDLHIFRSPLCPDEELHYHGTSDHGNLCDGLICAGNHVVGYVEDGVLALVAPGINWPEESVAQARREGWIERSWQRWQRNDHEPHKLHFADELAALDGLILEVGVGPGGGAVSGILQRNPNARIIVNDLSIAVLQLWREYLQAQGINHITMAAFDMTEPVLRPNTLDAISDIGGFGSAVHNQRAVQHTYQALRPGGRLFSQEIIIDPAEYQQLPREFRDTWDRVVRQDWRPGLEAVGYRIESCERQAGPVMEPEEGGLPSAAAKHGVQLHKHFQYIRARKP